MREILALVWKVTARFLFENEPQHCSPCLILTDEAVHEPRVKRSHLLALLALAIVITAVSCCYAADPFSSRNEPDPAFEQGLEVLKKSTGIIEKAANPTQLEWRPGLQLLIGVKAVEGSNQTVGFVELTTLAPPRTNADGRAWSPPLQTNRFDLPVVNQPSNKISFEFISGLYPVRLRVFDQTGRQLKEGKVTLPWALLTNSLESACRLSLPDKPGGKPNLSMNNQHFTRSSLGGMLSLVAVFASIQSSPALNDICRKAHCAIRLPGFWSMASVMVGGSLVVSLEPRWKDVTVIKSGTAEAGARYYRLPVDMKSGKRTLTTIKVKVGPSGGARVLLAGIQSIRAVHPTKAHHEFDAEVLASGVARGDVKEDDPGAK